jgi:hypothetical protein
VLEPARKNWRRLRELPRWRKSRTATLEPKRAIAKQLKALPPHAKLRSASALPRWKKSKTLRDEPNRAMPMTLRLLPRRAKDLSDSEEQKKQSVRIK